jgi:hypothetical protein
MRGDGELDRQSTEPQPLCAAARRPGEGSEQCGPFRHEWVAGLGYVARCLGGQTRLLFNLGSGSLDACIQIACFTIALSAGWGTWHGLGEQPPASARGTPPRSTYYVYPVATVRVSWKAVV